MALAAAIVTIGIAAIGAIVSLGIALFHLPPYSEEPKPKQLDFDFDAENVKRI